ncbi:MAG: protoporphyrinogen oxidase [Desulfopila sp.]|jgi:oxygen-dependent protoporphyrinogen oxidase|nr:protoporphyrinogen oxidase [Desulfopila sp.]
MMQHTNTLIIGAGLSGLTVAHKLRISCYGHHYIVLEKTESTGGVIRTHRENGYIAEIGPHGFLDNCRESIDILEECGLSGECIKAPLKNFVRYVLMDGELQMIPQTPLKILKAPLIPWSAKLRVLAELWQKPLNGEPTVAKWVHHRFGKALLPFADAVFTGTYAGDINRLTIDSVMPGLRKLELEHGSVIRGLLAKVLKAKKNKHGPKATLTMPAMTSFPQGMDRLPQRLTEYLREDTDLFLDCDVQDLSRENAKWVATTRRGIFTADTVVLATPTNATLALLQKFLPPPLPAIPQADILTVVFGFGPGSYLPPGFGYLTPEREKRFSLGTLFSSNMFPGRAPADHILFETLIGGRRHPERLTLSDDELIRKAFEDVRDVLPLQGEPVYSRVLRPWGSIPQLEQQYPELLKWRDRITSELPGLHICGFGWEGIGLNDMMKHGVRTAEAIRAGRENTAAGAELKGIYF